MTKLNFMLVALLALVSSSLYAETVSTVAEAKAVNADLEDIHVKASGQTLADALEALVERAPGISELKHLPF